MSDIASLMEGAKDLGAEEREQLKLLNEKHAAHVYELTQKYEVSYPQRHDMRKPKLIVLQTEIAQLKHKIAGFEWDIYAKAVVSSAKKLVIVFNDLDAKMYTLSGLSHDDMSTGPLKQSVTFLKQVSR